MSEPTPESEGDTLSHAYEEQIEITVHAAIDACERIYGDLSLLENTLQTVQTLDASMGSRTALDVFKQRLRQDQQVVVTLLKHIFETLESSNTLKTGYIRLLDANGALLDAAHTAYGDGWNDGVAHTFGNWQGSDGALIKRFLDDLASGNFDGEAYRQICAILRAASAPAASE